MVDIKQILKNFFYKIYQTSITSYWVRFIKLFFDKILSYFKYILLGCTILFFAASLYAFFYQRPDLILIGKNLSFYVKKVLNMDDILYLEKINISGNHFTKHKEISRIVAAELKRNQDKKLYQPSIIELLKNEIKKLPWVKEVVINRNLQDSISIHMQEYQPFAIWQDGKQKYIVSKSGDIIPIKNVDQFDYLIVLTGNNAHKNIKSLFNILLIDPKVSQNIYSATWIGDRRWDIRFINDLLVKLPSDNIVDTWKYFIDIYNMEGSMIGLESVDLRVLNKIYLKYNDSTLKELKLI